MLYVSLDCPLLVSSSVFSNVYLLSVYCVLCIQCCMCLCIVHYWFPLRLSLTFTYCLSPVSCVCCMCLWNVHYWLPLRLSLTFTYCVYTVSCVSNVVCVSGMSIIGFLFGCLVSNVYLFSLYCVLCIQCCMCLWIVHYWFPLRLSLTFTYCLNTVSCVFNVVCVSGLSIIGFLFGFL
jgi:hypothetical protein